ncbi:hypothetical protein MPNT_30069 [Candidatus Methylacidithermus pantelleriae]|uniref:Uncharacterized protein n=1 Tax=Candidatus Methylacidithermus pantelleriae TaxID=2744239 RepID=A0A8J2BTF8_9BACT|nr:hypothetical protein MPNT_30069 [Candidatus Methylacidithermus pantelleriae]
MAARPRSLRIARFPCPLYATDCASVPAFGSRTTFEQDDGHGRVRLAAKGNKSELILAKLVRKFVRFSNLKGKNNPFTLLRSRRLDSPKVARAQSKEQVALPLL